MLGITDLRKGALIKLDGAPWKVLEYGQKHMGRGGSTVVTKLKNLLDGRVVTKTFKGADKVEPADIETRSTQYLYSADGLAYFMDNQSFDQYEIKTSDVEDELKFIKAESEVGIQMFEGRPINVELPKKVVLEVTEAEDVVKGDTTGSLTKDIEVETGYRLKAPAFIKQGDKIVISTEDGDYRERANE
jgi:elongation factor P